MLFLCEGGLALIIEAKASKRDEPRREPEMAYPLIVSNFEESIQKGYDQAYRVKSKFLNKQVLNIFKDQALQQKVIDIKTKNYPNAFSIVVTLDRFGSIQTDLSDMLEVYDDDSYPWSVCIDDLEVFLLMMERTGKGKAELINFLKIREKLHGKLVANDELEVCGGFLKKEITNRNVNRDELFVMNLDYTDIFDHMYQKKGLGFENEKNIERKRSGKFMPIGGF